LLIVDKPLGWSSMDVCRRVKRATGGAKVGHAGTLDPLATGVVVCCLGRATSLVERLMGLPKTYEAQVDLSAFSVTDDREGPLLPVTLATIPTEAQVREGLRAFVGWIEQAPPAYSAVHIGGERAYDLARAGKPVSPQPRRVRVDAIEWVSFAWPTLAVRVRCGRGTYIRSLARDLGRSLGTGGHLSSLRRTRVGGYTVEAAADAQRLGQPIKQVDLIGLDAVEAGLAPGGPATG
jgi:tRNA pseudouridine55 synthase